MPLFSMEARRSAAWLLLCCCGALAAQPPRPTEWISLARLFPLYGSLHSSNPRHAEAPAGTPVIASGSMVNAATLTGPVAAGSVARISGNFLLRQDAGSLAGAGELAGVSVTAGGADAQLLYVSGGRIDFAVPNVSTAAPVSLVVTVGGRASASEAVTLVRAAPGIFSVNGQGSGQGSILDSTGALVGTANPAAPGATVLKIYCTGLGPVSGGAFVNPPAVRIGGVDAPLQSSRPNVAPGIAELTVGIPAAVAPGEAVPVVVTVNGVSSNTVTIAVAPPAPSITSVSGVKAGQSQTLTITGSGLGKTSTGNGGSSYLQIKNLTGKWSAGGAGDSVTVQVGVWTDAQISVTGFGGTYGQNDAVMKAGDSVEILAWNPETGAGPATYYVPAGDWNLIWSDEFNGAAGTLPDAAKWTYDLGRGGNGWGNNELESYTSSTDNVHTDGAGNLDIHVLNPDKGVYTSARIKTEGLFNFLNGRAEARIKLPHGVGIWPAFWTLGQGVGWPFGDEIDILENVDLSNPGPNTVYSTLHGPYVGQTTGDYRSYNEGATTLPPGGASLFDDFHLYGVQWAPTEITFFFDGIPFVTFVPHGGTSNTFPQAQLKEFAANESWVFTIPNFFILNVAVGGNWPGSPDATTVFPQDMLVDYVRVYQTGAPFVLNAYNATLPVAAGSGSVSFTTSDQAAAWSASVNNASSAAWITLASPTTGRGDGTVTFQVTANPYAGMRSAVLTVAGQTFFVYQHGTVQ